MGRRNRAAWPAISRPATPTSRHKLFSLLRSVVNDSQSRTDGKSCASLQPRRRSPQSCTHQARGLGKHHKCNGSRGGYVNQRIDQFRHRNLAGTAGNASNRAIVEKSPLPARA